MSFALSRSLVLQGLVQPIEVRLVVADERN